MFYLFVMSLIDMEFCGVSLDVVGFWFCWGIGYSGIELNIYLRL